MLELMRSFVEMQNAVHREVDGTIIHSKHQYQLLNLKFIFILSNFSLIYIIWWASVLGSKQGNAFRKIQVEG